MPTGVHTSKNIILEAIDSTGASVVLVGVQGDPSFGEETPDQVEWQDVISRGKQQGRTAGDEQMLSISWTAIDCTEARAFMDWVLFRSVPPPSTTDPIGGKALKLRETRTPVVGAPRVIEYDRSYWKCTPSGGEPNATITMSCEAYGRTEV